MVLQRAPLLKHSTQTEVAHTDQRPDLTSSENSIHTAAQRWGGTFKGNEFSRSAYDRAWKSTKAVFSIFSFKESRSVTRIAVTYTREHITDIQENADSLTYYEHWNKVVKYQPHRKQNKKTHCDLPLTGIYISTFSELVIEYYLCSDSFRIAPSINIVQYIYKRWSSVSTNYLLFCSYCHVFRPILFYTIRDIWENNNATCAARPAKPPGKSARVVIGVCL